jgi:hypothetical protein
MGHASFVTCWIWWLGNMLSWCNKKLEPSSLRIKYVFWIFIFFCDFNLHHAFKCLCAFKILLNVHYCHLIECSIQCFIIYRLWMSTLLCCNLWVSWSLQTTIIMSKSWLSDQYCHLWNLEDTILLSVDCLISFLLQPMSWSLWIVVISNWSWLLSCYLYLNSIVIFLNTMGLTKKHKINSLLPQF